MGLLFPQLFPKENRARKCRPTLKLSLYDIVFSLFVKSVCHIQIIEDIWTETYVFVKIT